MRNAFLNSLDDCNWLRETHLRGVQLPEKYTGFTFALLQGSEDSPEAVNLYVGPNPTYKDDYLRVRFVHESPVYCEYIEYSGVTDQPKWQKVEREPLAYVSAN